MKRTRGEKYAFVFIVVILVLLAFVCIYPVWYVLMYSLSESKHALSGGLFFWPEHPDLTGYKLVLQQKKIYVAYWNTIARTAFGTGLSLLLTAMLSYPLSLPRLKGNSFFCLAIFFTMLFNGGIIPTYLVISDLRMIDTFWALVVPGCINAFNVFIMRNFFKTIPSSLEESAMIDGANDIKILFHIILPLSGPVLAAVGMFYGIGYWNSYLAGILYVNSEKLIILQVYLRNLLIAGAATVTSGISDITLAGDINYKTLQMVTISVSIIPVLLVYPYLQRFYIKGVIIGSVKG